MSTAAVRGIVALYVLGLCAAGSAILFHSRELNNVPIVLLAFILPAVVYAVGAFRFFPEVLGAPSRPEVPEQRWTALLTISLVLYAAATISFMLAMLFEDHPPDRAALALGIVLIGGAVLASVLSCGLLNACGCERAQPQGWTRRLACVPRWFKPRVSLLSGAALVLITLFLGTTLTSCGEPRSGYNVLLGRDRWITAEHLAEGHHVAKAVLAYTGRTTYALALALAAASIVVVLISLRRRAVLNGPAARFLTLVAATLALFAAPDLFFAWWSAGSDTFRAIFYSSLVLRLAYWLVPLWLIATRAGRPDWPRVRTALLLLFLPIVLSDWALLTYVAALQAWGYAAYLAGLALLWWGYAQPAAIQQELPEERRRVAVGG